MHSAVAEDLVYLRPSTKIEPLSCRWWAWSHLVSPVQQAFNLSFRLLPMLRSFVANPSVHIAAVRDPKFLGGPFLHLQQKDVPAVRALLEETTTSCAHLIRFAEDLQKLERQLQDSAKGFSLEEHYAKLPASLAGLVELTYDLSNHPQVRVIEEMVYDGALRNDFTQELLFFDSPDEQRHFFLNTPRVAAPDRVIVRVPFDDSRLDQIAASRIRPVPFEDLVGAFGVTAARERFRAFFTTQEPERMEPRYCGDAVRLRYFGHACTLIQTCDVSILTDPVLAWQRDTQAAKLTFQDLPDFIDYVFLTHNHQDHFLPEVFLQLRNRIGCVLVPSHNGRSIADPSIKLTLRKLGFHNVRVMDPLDTVTLPQGCITSLPFYGEHSDLNIQTKQGMFLQLKGRRLLLLADSNCLDRVLYRRLAPRFGKVDALFIGMECHGAPLSWIYGPYLTQPNNRRDDESRRLSGSNCERAWAVVEEVGCAKAFVYAMGQEPWLKHILGLQYEPDSIQIRESNSFVQRCRDAGIPSERLYGCQQMMF